MAAEPLWPTYLQPSDVSTSIGSAEVWAEAWTYGLGRGSNPRPTVPQHSALNHSAIPARHLNPTSNNEWKSVFVSLSFNAQGLRVNLFN